MAKLVTGLARVKLPLLGNGCQESWRSWRGGPGALRHAVGSLHVITEMEYACLYLGIAG